MFKSQVARAQNEIVRVWEITFDADFGGLVKNVSTFELTTRREFARIFILVSFFLKFGIMITWLLHTDELTGDGKRGRRSVKMRKSTGKKPMSDYAAVIRCLRHSQYIF